MFENLKEKMTCGSVLLISILLVVSFVPMNSSAQAEAPEWEEGDEWAMGFEGDIQEMFSPGLTQLDQMINQTVSEDDELEEMKYDVEGEIGFYQIYEITEANDDGYVMEIEAGGGIEASGSFEATGELEEEGEYNMSEDIPKETKTISAEGEIFFMLDIEGTVHFDENYAIQEIDMNHTLEFSAEFSMENFPSHDSDWENNTKTIEYEDFSGSISVEAGLQIQMEFEPALDVFQFPIEEETSWTAKSNMTISGSYEGIIEVDDEELPEELQNQIEQIEDDLDQEFPIILEDLDTEDTEGLDEGEIVETTEEIEIPLKCTGTEDIILHDGTTTEAYVLEFDIDEEYEGMALAQQQAPSFQMMYSDDAGFIVSQQMDLGGDMGEIGNMVDTEDMQMESMDAEEAQESMDEAQQEEEEEDDGTPGFTLALLVIGALMAVLIYYEKER
ncbi:MAG: hypothetical protein KGY68_03035 [Candidatus Thermoplasmatota archaeon]|nr:hypothetical protein [Candidatus Thermoplasmatota archaeon]